GTDEFIATFSLEPLDLVQLVQPYLFAGRVVAGSYTTEFGLYAGGFGALALAWLAFGGRTSASTRRLGRGALGLALLGSLLALGQRGGIQPLLTALPLVGLFRAPCRYLLWIQIAVAVAVALAFASFYARESQRPSRALRGAAVALPLISAAVALW